MSYREGDIAFETAKHWVLRTEKGFEVYAIGVTHSTRCGIVGYRGEEGLRRCKEIIAKREGVAA